MGLYSRTAPDQVEDSLGEPRFDVEGRYQLARFGKVVVVNAYFPKGSGKDRDNSRVPYKLDFYRAVFDRVERLRRRYRVFVIGDWNTAHNEIDLARPKGNLKNSGFLPEERAEMDRWMAARMGRHLSKAPLRCARALHVVAAVGRGAREERRVAHRLRASLRPARCGGCATRSSGRTRWARTTARSEWMSRTEGRASARSGVRVEPSGRMVPDTRGGVGDRRKRGRSRHEPGEEVRCLTHRAGGDTPASSQPYQARDACDYQPPAPHRHPHLPAAPAQPGQECTGDQTDDGAQGDEIVRRAVSGERRILVDSVSHAGAARFRGG